MQLRRTDKGAEISPCGTYRYMLWRNWDVSKPVLIWVMLNPSTADAREDDPTIRKCCGFAQRRGYGGIFVVNLFAYRATDPDKLKHSGYQIGPENDHRIRLVCDEWGEGNKVVCAWGSHGARHILVQKRVNQVIDLLRDGGVTPCVLDLNAGNIPKHPLYIGYDQPFMEWKPWLL